MTLPLCDCHVHWCQLISIDYHSISLAGRHYIAACLVPLIIPVSNKVYLYYNAAISESKCFRSLNNKAYHHAISVTGGNGQIWWPACRRWLIQSLTVFNLGSRYWVICAVHTTLYMCHQEMVLIVILHAIHILFSRCYNVMFDWNRLRVECILWIFVTSDG